MFFRKRDTFILHRSTSSAQEKDFSTCGIVQIETVLLLPNIFYSLFFAFRSAFSWFYEDDIKPQALGLIISKILMTFIWAQKINGSEQR